MLTTKDTKNTKGRLLRPIELMALMGLALVLVGLSPRELPAAPDCAGGYAPGIVLASLRDTGSGLDEVAGAQALSRLPGLDVWTVRAPAGQECALLEALRGDPRVAWAELDYAAHSTDIRRDLAFDARRLAFDVRHLPGVIRHSSFVIPNDPGWANQWGPARIGAPAAWNVVTGTPDVVIAVIDSGVCLEHEDLAAKLWANPGEIPGNQVDDDGNGKIDDVRGWHFFHSWYNGGYAPAENADVRDDYGHGTHVAGIAAAATNNGRGIAGIAWGARILPVKVLDQYGDGWYSDIAAGIVYAADSGARIINLSLGGLQDSQTLRAAVDYARGRGALVIASAGNTGGAVFYPAAYEPVLAVAATDAQDRRASFSNYGPQVDMAAPGADIYSTWYRGNYFTKSGTSMAAPHVSGAAALVWSRQPDLAASDVISTLLGAADDVGEPGVDDYTGWGRVNAYRAVLGEHPFVSTCAPTLISAPGAHLITYTLILNNDGALPQTRWFTYTLDARQGYVSASWAPQGTLAFPTYEWSGEIEGGGKLTFTLIASITVSPGASLSVTATLTHNDFARPVEAATCVTRIQVAARPYTIFLPVIVRNE